ncbi:hypothetical protein BC831DRAFT_446597 [Entophlyctis helioformis]|nr:hypothetical protein BC831DRAFT_446597 [Entophlyctis helioformis]
MANAYNPLSSRRGPSVASESSSSGMVEISLSASNDSLPIPETIAEEAGHLYGTATGQLGFRSPRIQLLNQQQQPPTPILSAGITSAGMAAVPPSPGLGHGPGQAHGPPHTYPSQTQYQNQHKLQHVPHLPSHRGRQTSDDPFNNQRSRAKSVHVDSELIPAIVRFLDPADLYSCLTLSWTWFKAAAIQLYAEMHFSQLSGHRLRSALKTLHSSVVAANASGAHPHSQATQQSLSSSASRHAGQDPYQQQQQHQNGVRSRSYSIDLRPTLLEYHAFIRSFVISQIVFEEPGSTPLQSWYLVRDLLGLCAPTIRAVSLAIGDDSFMDLPADYLYLHAQVTFPRLSRLSVTSKCLRLPEKLILELLRASPVNGLVQIRLPRARTNTLGWDEQLFAGGLEQIAHTSTQLRLLDLSGHSQGIADRILFLLLAHAREMRTLRLPCGLSDAHLVAILTNEPWPRLRLLDMTCHCVDGDARERKPGGMSCNRFTDSVILAVLDHLAKGVAGGHPFQVLLPVTMAWLTSLTDARQDGPESVVYHGRVSVLVPTERMHPFG